ncbi:MAG: spermidine synthase [Gammaproteobacteria bacterium]|nr:spermidine synthase [Gammaproteobacteria bacterium]
MSLLFEELDYQSTPLGEIVLRRRADPRLQGLIIYEVLLGEEFLMSSLFTEAEIELASLALQGLPENSVDVVVGGLGLGYTAAAALQEPALKSLKVIEVMEAVIKWHRQEMVPVGQTLNKDSRCELVHADFFAQAMADSDGFDDSGEKVHAVLLDIDHSPKHWLNSENQSFYSKTGLQAMARKIHHGDVFGLWSNDPPDAEFTTLLESIFERVEYHVVSFANPYTEGQSSNTVYLAHK